MLIAFVLFMFPNESQDFPGWEGLKVIPNHDVLKIMPLESGTCLASNGFLVWNDESCCKLQGKFALVADPYSIAPASAGVLV